jgi:hypothetical protein
MLAHLFLFALPLLGQNPVVPESLRDAAHAGVASVRASTVQLPADSTRLLATARRAQENFELVRRRYLPREYGLFNHPCDVLIGRWCHWNDGDEDRDPPPESPRIIAARERLLAVLDSIGWQLPADEWIAGQRVRYLVEVKRQADGVSTARRCAAAALAPRTRAWCLALEGFALHERGEFAAADSAYAKSLAELPDVDRCRFTDISRLLDGDPAKRYRALPCEGRDAFATRIWRVAQPLYLLAANDWRTEFYSRVTRARLEQHALRTFETSWSDDNLESLLRYGGGQWYTREDPPAGSLREPIIASHGTGGSGFNFLPSERTLADPASIRAEHWDYELRTSRTRYAPPYAKRFRKLGHQQLALFRRGDSALVVAAVDVNRDTAFGREHVDAGLFVLPLTLDSMAAPMGVVRHGVTRVTVLTATAPWRPMLASLELLDSARRVAARERRGLTPPASLSRISLSDLLLYAPRDSTPTDLQDVLPLALPTEEVRADRALGLFWEIYGVHPAGEVFGVALTVEGIGGGWLRRAAETMRLATRGTPLRVQWQEVPNGADGIASRGVSVDLSRLRPGRYRINLTVTPRGEPPVVSTREVIVER